MGNYLGINVTGKTLNEKLEKIAREEYGLEFKKMSFTICFDKETSEEKIIQDAKSFFQGIKDGEKSEILFSSKK